MIQKEFYAHKVLQPPIRVPRARLFLFCREVKTVATFPYCKIISGQNNKKTTRRKRNMDYTELLDGFAAQLLGEDGMAAVRNTIASFRR